MNPVDAYRLASHLGRQIGAHIPLIGSGCDVAEYQAARCRSEAAKSLAHYLVQRLADRRAATILARAVGVPLP